jgi:archaellum component FlaC
MADTLSKNIVIQISADTDQLKDEVTGLNQTLDALLTRQQQLTASGQQNTRAFQDNAAQIKLTQTAIENHSKAIDDNVKALGTARGSLQQNLDLMAALIKEYAGLSKSAGDHSAKIKELNTQIGALSNTIAGQGQVLGKSTEAFDEQKDSVADLNYGFSKLNNTTNNFGPALGQAAKGFETLRSGMAGAKNSANSLDEALKKMVGHASSGADKLSKEKERISEKYAFEIEQAQGNSEKIKAIVTQRDKELTQIDKKAAQDSANFIIQTSKQIASSAFSVISNSIKEESAAKIAGLQKDMSAELNNRSLTSAQKLAIEQKYKQKENQEKTKAFKDEQKVSIAQALINGAIAVTKAEAQTGVLGALVIPGIIATTAIQVATITAQKPPAYAKGGLHYESDGRGGLLPGYSKTDNTNAYLRSGEGIVVSEAMQVPWARNLVSAINVGFGGRDFAVSNPGKGYAVGGIFTDGGDSNRYYNQPVTDQKNLANTIAYQMINNFPPVYVDVKDVNNQQNILAQTINRVNL